VLKQILSQTHLDLGRYGNHLSKTVIAAQQEKRKATAGSKSKTGKNLSKVCQENKQIPGN
jgi:hypothetical protein